MLPAAILAPILAAVAVAQTGTIDVPLSVTVHGQTEANRWELQLTNTGDKPVVAWSLEVVDADGHRHGTGRDVFLQLLGDRPDHDILHPSVPTTVDYRTVARLDGATLTPRAVVYADATAIGDAATIERIFADRRAKADALADVIPKLEALAQTGLTAESLTAASLALGDPTHRKRGSHVYQGLGNNLRLFSTSPAPEVGFDHMLEEMRRELQLAREHSVRRP
jgi:hypothetical protein